MPTNHSPEKIRNAITATLIRFNHPGASTQLEYGSLGNHVATHLNREDGNGSDEQSFNNLSNDDKSLFHDIFWDLFRQGIINIGQPKEVHTAFPLFRLSTFGKTVLENDSKYFFHDVITYENCLKSEIENIDNLTLLYLKEAMQTFLVGCYKSSAVMTGVALEYSLNLLYETAIKSVYTSNFSQISRETTLYAKFTKFKKQLDNIKNDLPKDLREDLEPTFSSIFRIIRNYRNDSGHPSDKNIKREECFQNLRFFIYCCKDIYKLIDFFTTKIS
jgi:hypothetical protein